MNAKPFCSRRLGRSGLAVGAAIHLVAVADRLCFEAADKYVRAITAGREFLVRSSPRELLPRLDEHQFWPVHRGVVVRATAIAAALRDAVGQSRPCVVSSHGQAGCQSPLRQLVYANLFKSM